ncbi:MAG: hypothetical protein LBK76_00380, partial [Verrucomicrobiales bacterium]|nr:hypothetical protein [Verrucomicrobiales bacterium]
MKTPILKTLTQILTLSALSVCFARRLGIRASVYLLAYFTALNVLAANKIVTGGTTVESDQTYESIATNAALLVTITDTNNQTRYEGTNITLSATFGSGNGRYAAHITNGASAYLASSTMNSTGSTATAVFVRNPGSTLDLRDAKVTSLESHGLYALEGASVTLGGNITIETYSSVGIGLIAEDSSVINTGNLRITSEGEVVGVVRAFLDLGDSAYLHSINAYGVAVNSGTVSGVNTVIVADNNFAIRLTDANGSEVYLQDADITSGGATAIAVVGRNAGKVDKLVLDGGQITVTDGDIIATGSNSAGLMGGSAEITFKNGVITNAGSGNLINNSGSTTINFTGENVELTGNIIGNDTTNTTVHLNDSAITGTVSGNDASVIDLTVTGNDSAFTGDLTASGSSNVTVNGSDNATITGNITGSEDSAITIGGDGNIIIGDVTGSGSSTIDVTITGTNSGATGDITGSGDSQIIITGSDGVIISGTVTGNENAVIDLAVTGSDSIFIGDITASGSSNVTITGSDDATITGNITGSEDSTITIGGDGPIIIGDVTGSGSATIDIG